MLYHTMTKLSRRQVPVTLALMLLLVVPTVLHTPDAAQAYSVGIHYRLPEVLRLSPELDVDRAVALPDTEALDNFRSSVYAILAETDDAELQRRFLTRYPGPEAFHRAAFKEFFGMAATHPALGYDPHDEVVAAAVPWQRETVSDVRDGEERSIVDWVRLGSIFPDLDMRNRGRWWMDNGDFHQTAAGEQIPYDPVILNMGRVEDLSGQAHAHYGLNRNPKSESPLVLMREPENFAVPVGFDGPVLTFAPERAQAYGDLAILARHLDEPALAAIYAGTSYHYLADLGNQIHTVQVGTIDFFVDATLEAMKLNIRCLWGLLCETMARNDIGIDIIGNHHTWLEELFRVALMRAEEGRPLHPALTDVQDLYVPREELAAEWLPLREEEFILRELAYAIIDAGNAEAAEVYELSRDLSVGELRRAGVSISFDDVDDDVVLAHLRDDYDPETMERFLTLQMRGILRSTSGLDFWWRQAMAPDVTPDWRGAADRLLRLQLDELDAADQRRAQWLQGR